MATDLFRGSISDLPDSVVLTLVDEVLPKIASAKDLYQAMLECPGRVLCTVSPSDSHSTTGRWLSCIDTCTGVVCACVSVCACMRTCMHVCVCLCVCVSAVHVYMCMLCMCSVFFRV